MAEIQWQDLVGRIQQPAGKPKRHRSVELGTIFSIYRRVSHGDGPGTMEDCLQQGIHQVAAGYVIYGSSTMLGYTAGTGVHGFTLDPAFGEFLLSHPNIQTPKKSKIYSINEGNYLYWHPGLKKYIKYLQEEDKATNRPYSSRYIGSMVADIHRTFYSAEYLCILPTQEVLMANYACNMNVIQWRLLLSRQAEAQRMVSSGLEIQPEKLHQRVPIFIGSEEDVKVVEKFMAEAEEPVN